MIQRIRRLGIGQMAKVMGALYFLIGIIIAALFGLFGSMLPTASEDSTALFGGAFLIAMPIIYGLFGVVFGALGELPHGEKLLDHGPDLPGLAVKDFPNEQHVTSSQGCRVRKRWASAGMLRPGVDTSIYASNGTRAIRQGLEADTWEFA